MPVVGSRMYRPTGIIAMSIREAALLVKWGDISHVHVTYIQDALAHCASSPEAKNYIDDCVVIMICAPTINRA